MLTAVLGGMYSSTTTTVALARRSRREEQEDPHLFAGSIVIASGVMYLRLIVLLGIFNRALMSMLAPSFAMLAAIAIGAGWYWCGRAGGGAEIAQRQAPKNPLELGTAFAFAAVFVAMLVATHLALEHFGRGGVYLLATAMGVSDVDPFVMGMTQAAPGTTPLALAAAAILIAAAANNVAKGVYAYVLASRSAGLASLALLLALAALGIAPLVWL